MRRWGQICYRIVLDFYIKLLDLLHKCSWVSHILYNEYNFSQIINLVSYSDKMCDQEVYDIHIPDLLIDSLSSDNRHSDFDDEINMIRPQPLVISPEKVVVVKSEEMNYVLPRAVRSESEQMLITRSNHNIGSSDTYLINSIHKMLVAITIQFLLITI